MPPISVCIIAKNEEEVIARCLKSVAPYGFEMIVVDTGSTDRTKEIAAAHGAKVFDFPWINDFAAARNHAASLATNNWILALDCDEYITQIRPLEILSLMRKFPRYVGLLVIDNEMLSSPHIWGGAMKRVYTTELVRFYPRKYYHFEGSIHEQVRPIDPRHNKEMAAFNIPLKLYHTGYVGSPEDIAEKNQRNIDMLLEALEKDPDDAYHYFQMGQTYALGDEYEKACEWFAKGLSFDLDPSLEYVQTMVVSYGQSLLRAGRSAEALDFVGIYDSFCGMADFVYMMGRIYEENGQPLKALGEFLKAITMPPGRQQGVNSFLPCFQIASIYEQMDNMEIALMYYRKCGDFPLAVKRLADLGETS